MSDNKKIGLNFLRFREVNFQLNDITYFEDISLDKKKILFDLDFNIELLAKDAIKVFIHTEYIYHLDESDRKLKRIFHGDFIAEFKFSNPKEVLTIKAKKVRINKEALEIVLGLMIPTTRGYLLARTRGSIIQNYPLPVIYPSELIESKAKHLKNEFYYLSEIE